MEKNGFIAKRAQNFGQKYWILCSENSCSVPHTHSHSLISWLSFFSSSSSSFAWKLRLSHFFSKCSLANFHIIYNLLFECNFIKETYHMKWISVMCVAGRRLKYFEAFSVLVWVSRFFSWSLCVRFSCIFFLLLRISMWCAYISIYIVE